jgi:hypothetical protein
MVLRVYLKDAKSQRIPLSLTLLTIREKRVGAHILLVRIYRV